jgi:hypothetical protein
MAKKFKKYQKRQPRAKLEPRRACYCIGDLDQWGVEFDAKFKEEEVYSRLFYIPAADHLYRWMIDRRPEVFVRIPIKSISEKRKSSLMALWEGSRAEEEVEKQTA